MTDIDSVLTLLYAEHGQIYDEKEVGDKFTLFRFLSNVRPPVPASNELLNVQDAYLTALKAERGIVDVTGLAYGRDVALYRGDITRLKCDAIVNAANSGLLGCFTPLHNCIDNIIHTYAGIQLRIACAELMQGKKEKSGSVKVTPAFNLPSKWVFHTVGPIVAGNEPTLEDADLLKSCYRSCLNKAVEMDLDDLTFCCISTGVFGYPKAKAARIAIDTVKEFKKKSKKSLKIIFDVYDEESQTIYERELKR